MIDLDKIRAGDILECILEYNQMCTDGSFLSIYLGQPVTIINVEAARVFGWVATDTCVKVITTNGTEIEISGTMADKHFKQYVPVSIVQSPFTNVPVTVHVDQGTQLSTATEEKKVPYKIDLDWEDYDYYGNLQ